MPYWRLFYHLVWSTRDRVPLIDDEIAMLFRRSVHASCKEMHILSHAIGTMPDHVHLALSIPPGVAVGTAVGRLKGATSHLINEASPREAVFSWQKEYGVLSFGERHLPEVVAYVDNQIERHANNMLWPRLETIADPKQREAGAITRR